MLLCSWRTAVWNRIVPYFTPLYVFLSLCWGRTSMWKFCTPALCASFSPSSRIGLHMLWCLSFVRLRQNFFKLKIVFVARLRFLICETDKVLIVIVYYTVCLDYIMSAFVVM